MGKTSRKLPVDGKGKADGGAKVRSNIEDENMEFCQTQRLGDRVFPRKESDSSDDSDEEGLVVLAGDVKHGPEVEWNTSSDSEEEDPDADHAEADTDIKEPARKKAKGCLEAVRKTELEKRTDGRKKKTSNDGILRVEFVFCDMNERFFHGLKTLLSSQPVHASHSSELSDLLIENVSVGTVVSTEGSDDVFGFASVINCTTNAESSCIKGLKKLCLDNCPDTNREEMEMVLSGKTRRPAGFLVHGRMINTPIEIAEVLHQQLVLDMDWAVENAEGGEEERKSLDFGAFVVVAPCVGSHGENGGVDAIYKHFDDEIFALHAEFKYIFDAPSGYHTEEKQFCSVIVLTKTGHRDSMKELAKLVRG